MKPRISAVILTKNEQEHIVFCIKSLLWCDEIVIVDDYSVDKTLEKIASLKKPLTIFQRKLDGNFSEQRNFGLAKTSGEWILFVDADEVVTDALKHEILTSLQNNHDISGFEIRRVDSVWGGPLRYGEGGNMKLLRLVKKHHGLWKGKVHEVLAVKGEVQSLTQPLLHYPHNDISEFLNKINFYTTIRAKELYSQQKKVHFLSMLCYPIGKFVLNYFLKRGFLDGTVGLVHAMLMSFHSFMVRGKLWLLWQKK